MDWNHLRRGRRGHHQHPAHGAGGQAGQTQQVIIVATPQRLAGGVLPLHPANTAPHRRMAISALPLLGASIAAPVASWGHTLWYPSMTTPATLSVPRWPMSTAKLSRPTLGTPCEAARSWRPRNITDGGLENGKDHPHYKCGIGIYRRV